MANHHFLIISLPIQSHLNPTLQLAKRLIHGGAHVTYTTTIHGLKTIKEPIKMAGLSYASFSDGYDDGWPSSSDGQRLDWIRKLESVGSQSLKELLIRLSNDDHTRITFLIYTLTLPWAADVATELGIGSAFLCIQSATSFAIYDRCFNTRYGSWDCTNNNPPDSIQITGLPIFTSDDMPTFLIPGNPYETLVPMFQDLIETLERHPNSCVLLNTFHALEEASIQAVGCMKVFAIGPLIPSAFLDENYPEDKGFGCDLFDRSKDKDYLQWLNSKPNSSVVYVSFGSLAVLKKEQIEELFEGLVSCSRPFLIVIRPPDDQAREALDGIIKKHSISEDQGLIIPWCCQVEVLSHPSVGCFVSHLGWNSTLESLVAGVPVVACPLFADQVTNAKMVDEVWKNGVRAKSNEEGVVGGEEIKRCVEIVLGDGQRGEEIRANALKWRGMAMDAVKEDGSANSYLKLFKECLGEEDRSSGI